jgi:hypothetical protein
LNGQSFGPFKFTAGITAQKARTRDPGGARLSDVTPGYLASMPTSALAQAISISYLNIFTVNHDCLPLWVGYGWLRAG